MTTRSQPRVWQICLQSIKSDVKNSETKFLILFKLVHLCYVLYLLSWLYLLIMFQTFVLYFSFNTVAFSTVSSLINFSTHFCCCRVGVAVTTSPTIIAWVQIPETTPCLGWLRCCWFSLPCSERFFTGYSGFALSKNQHIQILIRPGIR